MSELARERAIELEIENAALRLRIVELEARHTDRAVPCPKCGFYVRRGVRPPFVFDECPARPSRRPVGDY